MQIASVEIKNFRSIKHAKIDFENMTALIGANNSGKSTVMKAVHVFFEPAPKLTRDDFYYREIEEPIEITITFHKLTPAEKEEFKRDIVDEALPLSRVFESEGNGAYQVTVPSNPEFIDVRSAVGSSPKRTAYKALREVYPELPTVARADDIEGCLSAWEAKNPDRLVPMKRNAFRGAENVGAGTIGRKTKVHLIEAIRDIAAETESNKSPILSLLNTISQQTFDNKVEIQEILKKAQADFEKAADPASIPQLAKISDSLTESLQQFYPEAVLSANWEAGQGVSAGYPTPRINIEHARFATDLSKVGHGLQRAALFSIVQYLAENDAAPAGKGDENDDGAAFSEPQSDIILLVEEPEIFQHPSKQLAIFNNFQSLVKDFSEQTGIRVQIVYTTHSEKFVSMTNFDQVRILRRRQTDGEDWGISVAGLTLETFSKDLADLNEDKPEPWPVETLKSKLHIFGREVCEGFFADRVILVEGITDKAVLEAWYKINGVEIHSKAIAVIDMEGKSKLDKPAYIFGKLNIPAFVVLDNDEGESDAKKKEGHRKSNRMLQRICGVEDVEDFPKGVYERMAAFPQTLEKYLANAIGEADYTRYLDETAREMEQTPSDLKKNAGAYIKVLERALKDGKSFAFLDEIIEKVETL